MISTSTCIYTNPVLYNGNLPTGTNQVFNFASSTCSTQTTATSSTLPAVYNGFSYDGIIINFFLFIITAVMIYTFIYDWSAGIRAKRIS
jgi:hypothetical protein